MTCVNKILFYLCYVFTWSKLEYGTLGMCQCGIKKYSHRIFFGPLTVEKFIHFVGKKDPGVIILHVILEKWNMSPIGRTVSCKSPPPSQVLLPVARQLYLCQCLYGNYQIYFPCSFFSQRFIKKARTSHKVLKLVHSLFLFPYISIGILGVLSNFRKYQIRYPINKNEPWLLQDFIYAWVLKCQLCWFSLMSKFKMITFWKIFCAQNSWFRCLPPVTVFKLGPFKEIMSHFCDGHYYLEQNWTDFSRAYYELLACRSYSKHRWFSLLNAALFE
jgi:hypothetical protein